MSDLSSAAKANLEAARQSDGKFGNQPHSNPGQLSGLTGPEGSAHQALAGEFPDVEVTGIRSAGGRTVMDTDRGQVCHEVDDEGRQAWLPGHARVEGSDEATMCDRLNAVALANGELSPLGARAINLTSPELGKVDGLDRRAIVAAGLVAKRNAALDAAMQARAAERDKSQPSAAQVFRSQADDAARDYAEQYAAVTSDESLADHHNYLVSVRRDQEDNHTPFEQIGVAAGIDDHAFHAMVLSGDTSTIDEQTVHRMRSGLPNYSPWSQTMPRLGA